MLSFLEKTFYKFNKVFIENSNKQISHSKQNKSLFFFLAIYSSLRANLSQKDITMHSWMMCPGRDRKKFFFKILYQTFKC